MVFSKSAFVEPDVLFVKDFSGKNYAPMLRRHFKVGRFEHAVLRVCGLGYGYYYMNGKKISEDLFTAPVSNYEKTLWYNEYDVSDLLVEGENLFAAILGNGWYNEEFDSPWEYNKASWRGLPKLIMELELDGAIVLSSDEAFRCKADSAIFFNALRSGEYFDANKYEEDWNLPDYEDGGWPFVRVSDVPPKGCFRKCFCEPVRECQRLGVRKMIRTGNQKYVFDMGVNISGYIRLSVRGEKGDLLTIRYAEQLKEDFSLELNAMDTYFKGGSLFQTDKFICSGKRMTWSPRFAYHGFRYIEIDGIKDINDILVEAVFVHQKIERHTEFQCSNDFLNCLFEAGVRSSYSNMFYMITDCPTREKLGWTNDAQASCRQMLVNFQSEKLWNKWLMDIYDAQKDSGELPGIIPTAGWGYQWGNGPVSDGVLFEIPYQLYLNTGDGRPLKESLDYFDKYFAYIETRRDPDGFVRFGLDDWANPGSRPEFGTEFVGFGRDTQKKKVPVEFINAALLFQFYHIAAQAADLCGVEKEKYIWGQEAEAALLRKKYRNSDGTCRINAQTAVAMLIDFGIYEDMEPLNEQLKKLVEENAFHHDCGMVGLRHLYYALEKCGLSEYAFKIITAEGYPGYRQWFLNGATTFWETWDTNRHNDSKNHHMYSDVLVWLIESVLGIRVDFDDENKLEYEIKSGLLKDLTYVCGSYKTDKGIISVDRRREKDKVILQIEVKGDMRVRYGNTWLKEGRNCIYETKGSHL